MTETGAEIAGKTQSRVGWMDTARGIAIILMVYGHAARGLVKSGELANSAVLQAVDDLIYSFHMPLFFVVSGLTFSTALKRPFGSFAKDRALTLVWPYILWTVVHVLISVMLSKSVNSPVSLADLSRIAVVPQFHFWFLGAMLVCHLAGYAIGLSRLLVLAAIGLTIVLPVPYPGTHLGYGFVYFCYFGIGMLAGPWVLRQAFPADWRLFAGIGISAAAFALLFLFPAPSLRLDNVALGMAGVIALSLVSVLIGDRASWLARFGQATMVIFVLHTLVSSGLRIVLRAIVPLPGEALLAVLTIAGLVIPYVIGIWATRMGLTLPLGLGRAIPAFRPREPRGA